MHQPCYKNPFTGVYILPWVRLHAIRGYTDMIHVLDQFPEIHCAFNMVPSLVEQIEEYASGNAQDKYLDLSRKPAKDLTLEERCALLESFFMCNWETMIQKYPGYLDLLRKRGTKTLFPDELSRVARKFSSNEFQDLQVWFNLTWFGYISRKRIEGLNQLIEKGRNFTEEEKNFVLDRQLEVIRELIPKYRQMMEAGRVELTCSPFFHPILPLVYDTEIAGRTLDGDCLPPRFNEPEDAAAQIKTGIQFHEKVFGQKPKGMWPSEGSVAPELISLFESNGIQWIGSDEGILWSSKPAREHRNDLYRSYLVTHRNHQVNMVFRDTFISDRIGFTYAKNSLQEIEKDFFGYLDQIRGSQKEGDPALLTIILDGENAWEHFPDGADAFFHMLYGQLEKDQKFQTVNIGDFLSENPPSEKIEALHSGSWIGRNYNIWVGGEEENHGWDYLRRTRRFLKERAQTISESIRNEVYEKALREIRISEGSDWFWWFGDNFQTENDREFDELFRLHLQKVYVLLETEVPPFLQTPIRKPKEKVEIEMPVHMINPEIDGKITSYFEWLGAGRFLVDPKGTSMFFGDRLLSSIYFGFNLTHLFLRLDFRDKKLSEAQKDLTARIHLRKFEQTHSEKDQWDPSRPPQPYQIHQLDQELKEYRIEFPLNPTTPGKEMCYSLFQKNEAGEYEKKMELPTIGIEKIVELATPFEALESKQSQQIDFHVEILRGKLNVERMPVNFNILVSVPDSDFEQKMWSV